MHIIEQIKKGIVDQSKIEISLDRREIILKALTMADSGDIILVVGKGHVNCQEFADMWIHFDDREVVQSLIQDTN